MAARKKGAPEASAQSPGHPEMPGVGEPASPRETSSAPVPDARVLARRVRASKALTGQQKRYWLAILPHLVPEDRARLDAILAGAPA